MAALAKIADAVRNFRRPKQIDLEDYLGKLRERGLAPDGKLVPDPVPIAPPIGYKKQPSMVEIVRDMVRGERLRQEALSLGRETFEEAEDFDIGDEPELMHSPFENDFDPPLSELLSEGQKATKAKAAAPPPDGPTAPKTPKKGAVGPTPPSPEETE